MDKLVNKKSVHLVVADLFLPNDFASEVCAGLNLPALQKILARGAGTTCNSQLSLEEALCGLFGIQAVAPISAAFDGLGEGCWLRADPVHVRLQREQVVLLPVNVSIDESVQLCASLNEHFANQGLEFFAPHPARWYLRLAKLPDISTVPLSQASGRNIHGNLPTGTDAVRWHQLFNEIQMLLFSHPLNEVREVRGEVPINSVWFWGGYDTLLAEPADCGNSRDTTPCASDGYDREERGGETQVPGQCDYDSASSDEVLVQMLAQAAGTPFLNWSERWHGDVGEGRQLLVWTGLRSALQRGDLAAWRSALEDFEASYAKPLWDALRGGKIAQLQLDVLGGDSVRKLRLTRTDAWAFWRQSKKLADYSAEPKNNE